MRHPHGRIRTKIEVFDWLLRNEDKRVGKNPAGYLVASIRSDYTVPGDYQAQVSASQAKLRATLNSRGDDPQRSRHAATASQCGGSSPARQDQRSKTPRSLGTTIPGRARRDLDGCQR